MKSKVLWWILGGVSVLFILSSLVITLIEYDRFKSIPSTFPSGSTIAGVPVDELGESEADERVSEFYDLPLILEINDTSIQANPNELGFSMDVSSLVSQGYEQITNGRFWEYLWGNTQHQPISIPLKAAVDEEQLKTYLTQEVAPRYTQPGIPITPISGTTNFMIPRAGEQLDVESAMVDIRAALLSPATRQVTLDIERNESGTANLQMLQSFLIHNIKESGFDNLVEVYLESMGTGQTLHFAVQNSSMVEPNVAFTAASTIKIPVMISVLRRTTNPTPEEVINLLEEMIVFSQNPPADTLMSTYLDELRGPLLVSEDLEALGLENTFLAGYFYLGAPVLKLYKTPANTRTDIFLDPDIYNQTIPAEAGQLLSAIYQCAEDGGGLLTETFPGELTQEECQLMFDVLSINKIGLLIEAGLPPEASIAHKHGWVQELDGLLHSMSDVAIVSTPGEDYVLTIFIHDPVQLNYEQGNRLFARLSQTVYNFYNINNQAYWWFD
ncbi:MAG: serine hydrolase [Chloroflexota bacterium]|nr:serine hydrolase [Chloroflexota bacterium]